MKDTLPFTLLKVTRSVPSYKSMSGANHDPSARDGIARCGPYLSPDNSVMLGLACIDLGGGDSQIAALDGNRKYSLQADRRSSQ